MTDLESPNIPETAPASDPRLTALEERVRLLEETVNRLQDTRQLEERVTAKVTERVAATPSNPMTDGLRQSAGVLLGAGKMAATAAVGVLAAGAAAAETRALLVPVGRRQWLLFDILADLRMMKRMYFDRRFILPWQARILPLVLIVAIATSWLWVRLIPIPLPELLHFASDFLLGFLNKIIDLILALFLWQTLHREVQRYREAVANLPSP